MKEKLIPWIAAAVIAVMVFMFQTGLIALLLWISDMTNGYANRAMSTADIVYMIIVFIATLAAQLALVFFPVGVAVKRFGFSYVHLLLTLPVIYVLFTVFHVSFFFLFIFTPGDFFSNLIVVAVMGVVMLIVINNTKWRIKRKSLDQHTRESNN